MASTPTKICAKCGRRFTWRAKWSKCWDQVRFCSARCRRDRVTALDQALEDSIVSLLMERRGKTICPSEAARRVDQKRWRALIEPARQAARRLVAAGKAEVLQGGRRVDPTTAKGPIRIRLVNLSSTASSLSTPAT
ncbi:MAG: DUF2256 and DUF3253 domain-containing protein [Deltaproteobacteria bacterium]|nr:DUF2256 and DUF3253 domain-containing protein [Deltaproteobacteria bacterium]NND30251.1 DUF2256 and DUF3253 domain-containing protein [Myxococcales bacterium]MBT8465816.1 DUF2256 and DUF3253 domain-containing protein [Deltaproteobacteria bacterium]MBT8481036.1 DUF2256 and DUF3253 domain-containing protein [Deltaproteobacteria bacterium]NNK07639.1 DUF2256 and DUF3253 domain-containing protein [Myxococcales bacterium]